MNFWLPILLSALAMTLIVGVRYLITSGAFAWLTLHKYPALYAGYDTANPARNFMESGQRSDLWHSRWHCRVGVGQFGVDADLYGRGSLSAVVFASVDPCISFGA